MEVSLFMMGVILYLLIDNKYSYFKKWCKCICKFKMNKLNNKLLTALAGDRTPNLKIRSLARYPIAPRGLLVIKCNCTLEYVLL